MDSCLSSLSQPLGLFVFIVLAGLAGFTSLPILSPRTGNFIDPSAIDRANVESA